ncbi:MAG: oxaloacetate decarboxylase subunit alpha [Bacillota bacterium]
MRRVGLTDTTLRDAHQSLLATRMKTEDMLPIAPKLDAVGFHSLEVWGGATFDSCLRFLNEDPWERLRALRRAYPNTRLQMLLRGQNLVGYRHYADDVVEAFVKKTVSNGIDILRIFDALNDVRNMRKAIEVTKKAGGTAQGTVCYTISPVHDVEHYVNTARVLADMGADSICIKDMAGIISPTDAYTIVKRIKEALSLPVQLHCHYTSGMASMSYLKAIEAGCDVVDTAISPMALATSQPPTETMVAALQGTPYDTGLDLGLLAEVAEYFRQVRKKYREFDVVSPAVDTNVLRYQIPGGMISNFISQLQQQNEVHRLSEVLEEVPRVRADMGYPPLVTPSSQMVGTQAVLNVLTGRYKMPTNETRDYMRGLYGQPPGPVNEEVRKQLIGDEAPITARPADFIEPGLEKARAEVGAYYQQEEDVLSYALFPQQAMKFFQERLAGRTRVDYGIFEESRKNHPPGYHPV